MIDTENGKLSDGPNGIRGENIHASTKGYCFPCGSCVGATFDANLVYEMGKALGKECRMKNAGVLLGPTINLHRSPLGTHLLYIIHESSLKL